MRAAAKSSMLGPGQLFLVSPHPTAWLRFNVTFSEDEWRWSFLIRSIERQQCRALSQQVEERMQQLV